MKTLLVVLVVLFSDSIGVSQSKESRAKSTNLYNTLKLVHEDARNPIAFVVPQNTTSEQLKMIVYQIRGIVRAHQFASIGMQIGNSHNTYDTSGAIWIYRSRRCLSESYTDGRMPCGDETHYDAYYQWGTGGIGLNQKERYECDAGGIRKPNGYMVDIFNEGQRCQQLATSRGQNPQP